MLIGNRLNLCALVYAFWLLLFVNCSRPTLSKMWYFFNWFVAITIPLQYVIIVGLPPELCLGSVFETFIELKGYYRKELTIAHQ